MPCRDSARNGAETMRDSTTAYGSALDALHAATFYDRWVLRQHAQVERRSELPQPPSVSDSAMRTDRERLVALAERAIWLGAVDTVLDQREMLDHARRLRALHL